MYVCAYVCICYICIYIYIYYNIYVYIYIYIYISCVVPGDGNLAEGGSGRDNYNMTHIIEWTSTMLHSI